MTRLRHMRVPPRVHCFGHDHDYFGVAQNGATTFINAAQHGLLGPDTCVGGCALEFDVAV
jgi:Icc-related predicted phosphoesterase